MWLTSTKPLGRRTLLLWSASSMVVVALTPHRLLAGVWDHSRKDLPLPSSPEDNELQCERYLKEAFNASDSSQHTEAEAYFKAAIQVAEQFGEHDRRYLRSLRALSLFYSGRARHEDAERVSRKILALAEQCPESCGEGLRGALYWLAIDCKNQGKYQAAEQFLSQGLAIGEATCGVPDPSLTMELEVLAFLAMTQGNYSRAQHFLEYQLTLEDKGLSLNIQSRITTLTNLAIVHTKQGRPLSAEHFRRRATMMKHELVSLA
jgi:tetratricopeptide (TPR) repeat protein